MEKEQYWVVGMVLLACGRDAFFIAMGGVLAVLAMVIMLLEDK